MSALLSPATAATRFAAVVPQRVTGPTVTTTRAAQLLEWPIRRVMYWADSGQIPCDYTAFGKRLICATTVARLAGLPSCDIPPGLTIYRRGSAEPTAGVVYDACGDEWVRGYDSLWRLAEHISDLALYWNELADEYRPLFSHRWTA